VDARGRTDYGAAMKHLLQKTAIAALIGALALALQPVAAADVKVGDLQIIAPWTRATPKGAKVASGYLTIVNGGKAADRLVSGASDFSENFEIHEMSMTNGVMRMRELTNGLEIKPGQKVELKPGGYHVMFMGLKKPLQQGETVKVTLTFEKAGKVEVAFPVAALGAQSPGVKAEPQGGGTRHGH
jgi:copper(I)-binding protein